MSGSWKLMVEVVCIAMTSLGLTVLFVPWARRGAIRLGLVAQPRNDRWHSQPVPLMGGAAIMGAFWLTVALCVAMGLLGRDTEKVLVLVVFSMVVFVLGLWDDKRPISPQTKLLVQMILASLLVLCGFKIHWLVSKTLNTFLSILWIVAVTNAFNLLDNMDGLSAGVGAVACVFLIAIEMGMGFPVGGFPIILVVLLGALLGFLVYNFHPASVFMGDCGSLSIGFLLAAASTQNHLSSQGHLLPILLGPILIFSLPLADMAFVSVMRLLSGRSIMQGGRDHTSHRLVAIGLSEPKAVCLLYGFSVLGGCVAVLTLHRPMSMLAAAGILSLLTLVFLTHLAKVRTYGPGETDTVGFESAPTLVWLQWTYKKRMFEVLLDICIVAFTYWLAHYLRYETEAYNDVFPYFLKSLPAVAASCLAANLLAGIYRGVWRYTSTTDLAGHSLAVTMGVVLSIAALVVLYDFQGFSRGTFGIFWALYMVALSGSRVAFRFTAEWMRGISRHTGRRVLIFGANERGGFILQELWANAHWGLRPIGFVDENRSTQNRKIFGLKVLGTLERIPEIVNKYKVDEIVVPVEKAETIAAALRAQAKCSKEIVCRHVEVRLVPSQAGLTQDMSEPVETHGS